MKKILLPAFLFGTFHLFSQNKFVVSEGANSSMEALLDVIETPKGNYISVGYSLVPVNNYDVYITDNDKNGALLWAKTMTSADGRMDDGFGVINTRDGDFAINGILNSKAGIAKFDSAGTLLWSKEYNIYAANKMVQTDDGGFMISGSMTPGSSGRKRDAYILKTDSAGNIKWSKEFFPNTYYSDILDIKKTNDNNYVLLSINSNSTVQGDTSYVIKIDTSGNVLWSKYILSLNAGPGAGGHNILPTSDSGYLISGTLYSINAAFITKLDSNGNMKWSKYINSQGTYGIYGYNTIETSDGYITCGDGTKQSNAFFIFTKLNKTGELVWIKTVNKQYFTDNVAAYYLVKTRDRGFVSVENDGIFYTDAILTKFDANFNTCLPEGTFGSLLDFGSINSTKVIPINGNVSTSSDSFIVSSFGSYTTLCTALPLKLISFLGTLANSSVKLQWQTASEINTKDFEVERSSDGVNFNALQHVAASNKNNGINVYNVIDNKPLNGKSWYRLKIIDNDESFIYSSIVPVTNLIKSFISIIPNPVGDVLNLNVESIKNSPVEIKIYASNGKLLLQKTSQVFRGNNTININVSNYAKGMYLVKVIQNTEAQNLKWIK